MSTAQITVGNTAYIIPILPPLPNTDTQYFIDKFYIKNLVGQEVRPSDQVVAELMAASQSIFMLQSPSYSLNPSTLSYNDRAFGQIEQVNNQLRQLESSLSDSVQGSNLINAAVTGVLAVTGAVVMAKIAGPVLAAATIAKVAGVAVTTANVKAGIIGGVTLASMATEYVAEMGTANQKLIQVSSAIELLNMAYALHNEFVRLPAANIYEESGNLRYSLNHIEDAVAYTSAINYLLDAAKNFISAAIELESNQNWVDILTDAFSSVPVPIISLPANIASLVTGQFFGNKEAQAYVDALENAMANQTPVYSNPFNEEVRYVTDSVAELYKVDSPAVNEPESPPPAISEPPVNNDISMDEARETVQILYIGFYGRPADPEGQEFWAKGIFYSKGNTESIINAFANSEEYQQRFGNLTTQELVNNLYQQSFGRSAEPAGLDYWTQQINRGAITLGEFAYELLKGAKNNDLATVNKKLEVAQSFTEYLDAYGKHYGMGEIAMAKSLLDDINHSTNTGALNIGAMVRELPDSASVPTPAEPTPVPPPVPEPEPTVQPGVLNFRVFDGTQANDNMTASIKRGEDVIVFGKNGNDNLRVDVQEPNPLVNKTSSIAILTGGAGSDQYNLDAQGITGFIIYDGSSSGVNSVNIPIGFDYLWAATMNGGKDLLIYDSFSFGLLLPDWKSPNNRIDKWILDGVSYSYNDLVSAVNVYSEGDISTADLSNYLEGFSNHSASDLNQLMSMVKQLPEISQSQIDQIKAMEVDAIGVPSYQLVDVFF